MNSARKTGVCMSGPAWIERNRKAIPAAHISAVTLMIKARPIMPARSTPPPSTRMPAVSAIPNSSAWMNSARTSAESA